MKRLRISVLSFFIICTTPIFSQLDKPKLVVGIVVDQMSYEYLYRYYHRFSEGGFKRLMNQGTNCRTTHYNYVPTYTGPGHASIYTGTTPANHGIVGNDWYTRVQGKQFNCVHDGSVSTVGSDSDKGMYSPVRLKVNTITDHLKLSRPDSKVISVSVKNRGAILPGGHLSDGTYWYDATNGKMITSTFFKTDLPQWARTFNDEKLVDKYLNSKWETYFPINTYTASGPDDTPYEYLIYGKDTPTFPYNLAAEKKQPYDAFLCTPFANTFLTDFAIRALKEEQLGKGGATDMLCISYSSTDIIGHAFGPQSVEIEDTYIRLDLELARFLKELDKTVGKGNYTLFLTADHAVVPVPQLLIDKKMAGGYTFVSDNLSKLKVDLEAKFNQQIDLEYANQSIYLNRDKIQQQGLDYNVICDYIKFQIKDWVGVKQAYTANELQFGAGDKWFEMVQRGYNYHESGDVLFILEAGFLSKSKDSATARQGTSHGSPFAYDTQVPLLFYGKGIPKMDIFRMIEIVDIAPTLAHIMNISYSHGITGHPIVEILNSKKKK